MVTPSTPSVKLIQQINEIIDEIDGVILRFDAPPQTIIDFITHLVTRIPKEKIIVHQQPEILHACNLSRIHFKEDYDIKSFKQQHPEIAVSQSVHSLNSARHAMKSGASFILFGHVFITPSKKGIPPRLPALIQQIVELDIPVVAIGGIDQHTIQRLHPSFAGFAGIRLFMDKEQLLQVKKEWLLRTTI